MNRLTRVGAAGAITEAPQHNGVLYTSASPIMSLTRCSAIALIVVALTFPLRATAQLARRFSLDMNVGPGYLLGGPEVLSRASIVLDGLLTMRLAKDGRSGLLAGMSVGWQGPPPSGDICRLGQDRQCLDDYPQFSTVGVLAGWTSAAGRVRVLGGVASVRADKKDYADRYDYTVGLPVRVDCAVAKFSHLAVVASLRGTVLPRYRGNAYTLLASGLGFRIY
ncbi:MAG TPA: hypothetical protein VIK25_13975 [Gemmatimonadaceae bacterium]